MAKQKMTMFARVARVLRRKAAGKSVHDMTALFEAIDRGLLTMSGPSDDLDIQVTEKGKQLLARKEVQDGVARD